MLAIGLGKGFRSVLAIGLGKGLRSVLAIGLGKGLRSVLARGLGKGLRSVGHRTRQRTSLCLLGILMAAGLPSICWTYRTSLFLGDSQLVGTLSPVNHNGLQQG